MDKDGGLQVVVSICPERALQKGAALDTCLDPGQRQMLGEKHLTAADLILTERHEFMNTDEQINELN